MNKKIRFIAALFVSCSIISSTVFADDLSNAKEKSEQIKSEMEENKSKISELEKSKDGIFNEISALDGEVDELNNKINVLNSQITQSTEKIKGLEQRASELKAEVEKNKDVMDKRMRVMYMNSSSSYIEVLLDSKDFSDLFSKLETITTMISFNNNVVSEFKASQKELDGNLEESTKEKKTLEEAKLSVDKDLQNVNAKKTEKSELMAKAEANLELAQSVLDENEAESQQIFASITAMEETAKKEAERASRGGTGSQSSNGGQTSSSNVSTGGMYSVTGTRYPITSPFMSRISPITGKEEHHNGIDIGAPYGAPVYALMNGIVTYAGVMNGYGNVVVISHGEISTLYAHNSSLSVSAGQTVSGGQLISNVGSTGWSTGPHLHFEVIKGGVKIEPSGYYF